MPNWCWCSIEARFADEAEAAAALTLMNLMDSTPEGHGRDMGMIDNWYFDCEVTLNKDILTFTGNVRWLLTDPQVAGLVNWFVCRGSDELEIEVEESSNNIYGKFVYKDGELLYYEVFSDSKVWDEYHSGESIEVIANVLEDTKHKDRRTRRIELKGEVT